VIHDIPFRQAIIAIAKQLDATDRRSHPVLWLRPGGGMSAGCGEFGRTLWPIAVQHPKANLSESLVAMKRLEGDRPAGDLITITSELCLRVRGMNVL
jgi:hypothetical protein